MKAEQNRQAMCLTKMRYYSRIDAKISATRCAERRGGTLRVYQCPWCFGWHLTKREEKHEIS
jgi:hypothetical protein